MRNIPSFKTMIGLLAVSAAMANAAEIQIDSIENKPNGVKLQWTNSEPGFAYTLQYLTAVTGSTWSNVWTRYRWPSVMTHWTEPNRVLSEAAYYRIVAEPVRTPERGKLLSATWQRQFSLGEVTYFLNKEDVPTTDVRWSVNYYQIVYETVDPLGLPIVASGGLYVPQGVPTTMPLLSYQHGTEIYKPWVPSQVSDHWWYPIGTLFASAGYVTVMPDYLGLGESPGLHPYLHAQTEATAVVDMLRAVRTFCSNQGVALNPQLFLTGFSQGGHATAAVHREIESHNTNEFTVTASAPLAGPYNLSGTLHHLLTNTNYPYPEFFIFALAAWLPIYDFSDTMEELLASPYKETLPPLFNGHYRNEIFDHIGPDVQSMLTADFRDALLNNPNHPFWQASVDNDLLNWAPQAPMRLFHCAGDDQVPFSNAMLAEQSYTNNGACCVSVIDPTTSGSWNHNQCYWPSLTGAKAWFDTMKP